MLTARNSGAGSVVGSTIAISDDVAWSKKGTADTAENDDASGGVTLGKIIMLSKFSCPERSRRGF